MLIWKFEISFFLLGCLIFFFLFEKVVGIGDGCVEVV